MSIGDRYAELARALVGCPFRPQGRDAGSGLDCVGLVAEVFGIPPEVLARDYRLRGDHEERLQAELRRYFRPVVATSTGDVLLFEVADDQLHLAVKTRGGFVHADAGLRRVVETPGEPPWTLLRAYRRRSKV